MNRSDFLSKKISACGLLVALAMIFSYIETLIPINAGLPGMKLGIANLVVVAALYLFGPPEALLISLVRILLVGFLFGSGMSILYSLAGGLVSFLAMVLLKRTQKFSIVGASLFGGAMHNVGQLLVAAAVVENAKIFYYLPPLLCVGCVTGSLVGRLALRILPTGQKIIRNAGTL